MQSNRNNALSALPGRGDWSNIKLIRTKLVCQSPPKHFRTFCYPHRRGQGAVSAAAAAAQAAEAAAQRGRLAEAAAAERLTELRLAAGQAEARYRECRRLCDRRQGALGPEGWAV